MARFGLLASYGLGERILYSMWTVKHWEYDFGNERFKQGHDRPLRRRL